MLFIATPCALCPFSFQTGLRIKRENKKLLGNIWKITGMLKIGFPFITTVRFSYPVPYPAFLLNAADVASQHTEIFFSSYVIRRASFF